jgi:hypothetical protein
MTGTKKLFKAVSTVNKKPPLQRSKVSGLREYNFGDIVFVDHADVRFRSETYIVCIVVDGAATCLTAFDPRTKDSHETVQCLMAWMNTCHCTPQSICADMAFHSTKVPGDSLCAVIVSICAKG